jgi:hypothetical protein
MMKWLTEDARLACDHGGKVSNQPSQHLVTINGRKVLVATDPQGRPISACPNLNPTAGIKPCTNTLPVIEGYSAFVTIDGHRVCLDTVTGLTDGTPPGTVTYTVKSPGQTLLDAVG